MFVVGPLDDLCDAETSILPKWKVQEILHQLIDDYTEKLIGDGEYATVIVAGKQHKVKKA